ncbi:MAG: hypothetical protein Q9214_005292 [Letrouitia sp. 1 TL-2023]
MTSPGLPKNASALKGSSLPAFDPDQPPAETKRLGIANPSESFPSAATAEDHALIEPTQESYQPGSPGLEGKSSSTRLASQYHESILPNTENEEPQKIIISSFSPRIAVFASEDTEALISDKGLTQGLCGLLKPFGEHVQGKVVIRDSVGVSRAWDDFAVRFISGDSKTPRWKSALARSQSGVDINGSASDSTTSSRDRQSRPSSDKQLGPVDLVVDQFINSEETNSETGVNGESSYKKAHQHLPPTVSMAYCQYLRKLLASESLVPYETFSHPVAGIIAVSSRSQKPLETLRNIYADTRNEGKTFPDWVGTEYLRYYLLVHDEDTDDIIKSTALFDLMKRHFGLHCHLLRLRSTQCVESDDDSIAVAPCKWAPPEEDLSHVRSQGASHSAFFLQESNLYSTLRFSAAEDFHLRL